jgi:anti-sigma factor RsiW
VKIAEDLTCKELVELVTDYLDDALSAEDRERFEQHLVLCDGCGRYLDQMRTTITLAGSLTEESLAPHVQERLLAVFRGWRRG